MLESSYQRFAKDVLVIGSTNILTALSSLIFLPVITKTLGANSYGIWVQVQVIVSVAMGVIGLGLPYAMTRFLPSMARIEDIKEDFYSAFCIVLLASAVVTLSIIAASGLIADNFFDGERGIVIITGIIILVSSLDWVFLGLYRARRQMKKYALFLIIDTVGQIGVITYLVLNRFGLLSIIIAFLLIRMFIFLVLTLLTTTSLGMKRPQFLNMKRYLSFGLPTIPGNIFAWAVASSDRYIIAYFLGSTSVGVYSAVYSLGTVPLMLATVMGFVLPPVLSKSFDEGKLDEVKTHLQYSLKYYLAVAIPFIFGSLVLAKPVLNLFSTSEIANEGYHITPIVALGILFYGAYAVIAHILVVVKKTKVMGLIWVLAGVTNVGLNIFIVPAIGIVGAALTTLFAYSLALAVGGYYSFREFRFKIEWIFILKSIIASAIMSSIVWLINPSTGLSTIITVVIGIVLYVLSLFILRAFRKDEYVFFFNIFRRVAS